MVTGPEIWVHSSFLPFPLEILAMANGLVFGLWGGICLTWVSMMLASWVGYAAARLARPLVLRLVLRQGSIDG